MNAPRNAPVIPRSPDSGCLAIKIAQMGELETELRTSRLCEISRDHEIAIPGVAGDHDEERQAQIAGRIVGPLFKDGMPVELDGFEVGRMEREEARADGKGNKIVRTYVFSRP